MRKLLFACLLIGNYWLNAQTNSNPPSISTLFSQIEDATGDSLLLILNQIEKSLLNISDDSISFSIQQRLAKEFEQAGKVDKTIEYYQKFIERYEAQDDYANLIDYQIKISLLLRNTGKLNEALDYTLSGISNAQKIKDTLGLINLYDVAGIIYHGPINSVIDSMKILEYSEKELILAQVINNKEKIARAKFMHGLGKLINGHHPESIVLFQESSDSYMALGDTTRAMNVITKIGNAYELQKKYNEALPYYQRFYNYARTHDVGSSYLLTSLIYYINGIINMSDKQIIRERVFPLLKEAEGLVKAINSYESGFIIDYYRAAYDALGDYENAYKYSQIFLNLKDSLNANKYAESIAELEIRFETEKKEQEIALLEKDKALQTAQISKFRTQILLLVIGLLTLLGLGGLIYYRNRLKQQLHLQNMRSQISSDLHDEIGSSLTRLSMIMNSVEVKEDDFSKQYFQKGNEVLTGAISKIRDVVWAIDARNDQTGDLLDRMEDFAFDMFKSRNINYQFVSDSINRNEILPPLVRQNVYLIFKEAITNIVKHSDATQVLIDFVEKDKGLFLNICDNGSLQEGQKVKGAGLSNMKLRAKRIKANLKIEQSDDGFQVTLHT